MNHNELLLRALKSIDELFSDTTVTPEETRQSLYDLDHQILTLIDELNQTIEDSYND